MFSICSTQTRSPQQRCYSERWRCGVSGSGGYYCCCNLAEGQVMAETTSRSTNRNQYRCLTAIMPMYTRIVLPPYSPNTIFPPRPAPHQYGNPVPQQDPKVHQSSNALPSLVRPSRVGAMLHFGAVFGSATDFGSAAELMICFASAPSSVPRGSPTFLLIDGNNCYLFVNFYIFYVIVNIIILIYVCLPYFFFFHTLFSSTDTQIKSHPS